MLFPVIFHGKLVLPFPTHRFPAYLPYVYCTVPSSSRLCSGPSSQHLLIVATSFFRSSHLLHPCDDGSNSYLHLQMILSIVNNKIYHGIASLRMKLRNGRLDWKLKLRMAHVTSQALTGRLWLTLYPPASSETVCNMSFKRPHRFWS